MTQETKQERVSERITSNQRALDVLLNRAHTLDEREFVAIARALRDDGHLYIGLTAVNEGRKDHRVLGCILLDHVPVKDKCIYGAPRIATCDNFDLDDSLDMYRKFGDLTELLADESEVVDRRGGYEQYSFCTKDPVNGEYVHRVNVSLGEDPVEKFRSETNYAGDLTINFGTLPLHMNHRDETFRKTAFQYKREQVVYKLSKEQRDLKGGNE